MKMTGIEESIVKLQSVNLTATKLFYVHVYRTSIHPFAHCVSHTDSIFNSISALSATRHSLSKLSPISLLNAYLPGYLKGEESWEVFIKLELYGIWNFHKNVSTFFFKS